MTAVRELVDYVCWTAPAGARRRAAAAIVAGNRDAEELTAGLLRSCPEWKPARAKYWQAWQAVVLASPAIDRAVGEALGPKRWLPSDEGRLRAAHERDIADMAKEQA